VAIPGYYDELRTSFNEIGQDGISTGNDAWAMLALLALHQRTGEPRYLAAAQRIGRFVLGFRNDQGHFQGLQGGLDHPESAAPVRRPWASTEHNLDLYAAFDTLARLDPAGGWAEARDHARQFVDAMWDAGRGCNLTGTTDPETRNAAPGALPEDVQAWAVLALPDALAVHPGLLTCAERNHHSVRRRSRWAFELAPQCKEAARRAQVTELRKCIRGIGQLRVREPENRCFLEFLQHRQPALMDGPVADVGW